MNWDSGTLRGHHTVWGGRAQMRAVFYMSTVSAIRCNEAIGAFYQRLRKVCNREGRGRKSVEIY